MSNHGNTSGENPVHGQDYGPAPQFNNNRPTLAATYYVPGYPQLVSQPMLVSVPVPASIICAPLAAAGSASPPVVDPLFPAANMINSLGGKGCEPGYSLFHNGKYTKVHVLRTGDTPPWLLSANFSPEYHACHVPIKTTIGELLAGFGATNPDSSKNKVWEVIPSIARDKWYKGMCFVGDDDGAMAKAIKDVGWDETRDGLNGGKSVVYLYITKG